MKFIKRIGILTGEIAGTRNGSPLDYFVKIDIFQLHEIMGKTEKLFQPEAKTGEFFSSSMILNTILN